MCRVVVVGIDAADWRLLNPMVDRGLLPTFHRFATAGTTGSLRPCLPLVDASLWTTMSTGRQPDEHGVLGGNDPYAALARQAETFWTAASQAGKRVHVIGWPATHPAEPVNGILATDQFASPMTLHAAGWPSRPYSIEPETYAPQFEALRVHPTDLTGDDLLPFIQDLRERDQDHDPHPMRVAAALAHTVTNHAAATWVLENEPWDLLCVHYPLLRVFAGCDATPACRYLDILLCRLMQLAGGADTLFVLASARGFSGAAGMIGLQGPGVAADELVHGMRLADVAPLVLRELGVPRPAAPSKPTAAQPQDWRARMHLALYYVLSDQPGEALPLFEQLNNDPAAAADPLAKPGLAVCYLRTGQIERARQVLESCPASAFAGVIQVELLMAEGRVEEARPLMAELERSPETAPIAKVWLGQLCLAERRWQQAESVFRSALAHESDSAAALYGLAAALNGQKRHQDAADSALAALGQQFDFSAAHFALGQALSGMGRHKEARDAIQNGVRFQTSGRQ